MQRLTIRASANIDKPLTKPRGEVSLSAFAFLFSELVQYCQVRVQNVSELERRLEDAGYGVGLRLLELLCYRESKAKRETQHLPMLRFVHGTLWRYMFGRPAQHLEQSASADDEYMISDYDLFVNRYISVPRDYSQLNCAAFVAGVVRGALDGAGFPARVTAHFVAAKDQPRPKTTILIKFDPSVAQREKRALAS